MYAVECLSEPLSNERMSCGIRTYTWIVEVSILVWTGIAMTGCHNECPCPDRDSERRYAEGQLRGAAAEGDEQKVLRLLASGVDINAEAKRGGATALCRAARAGKIDMVKLLISKGADVNLCCPLSDAAFRGHTKVAECLLAAGANPNGAPVAHGLSRGIPLYTAANKGHLEVVKLLVQHGAAFSAKSLNLTESPLNAAAANGHADVVLFLAGKGSPVNMPDARGRTPLARAAEGGHLDVVRALLAQGADASRRNQEGQTPAEIASAHGYAAVAKAISEWPKKK